MCHDMNPRVCISASCDKACYVLGDKIHMLNCWARRTPGGYTFPLSSSTCFCQIMVALAWPSSGFRDSCPTASCLLIFEAKQSVNVQKFSFWSKAFCDNFWQVKGICRQLLGHDLHHPAIAHRKPSARTSHALCPAATSARRPRT